MALPPVQRPPIGTDGLKALLERAAATLGPCRFIVTNMASGAQGLPLPSPLGKEVVRHLGPVGIPPPNETTSRRPTSPGSRADLRAAKSRKPQLRYVPPKRQ